MTDKVLNYDGLRLTGGDDVYQLPIESVVAIDYSSSDNQLQWEMVDGSVHKTEHTDGLWKQLKRKYPKLIKKRVSNKKVSETK